MLGRLEGVKDLHQDKNNNNNSNNIKSTNAFRYFFPSDYFAVRKWAIVMMKGKVDSTQKRKGREYKEVSRLAEKVSPKRQEKETPVE